MRWIIAIISGIIVLSGAAPCAAQGPKTPTGVITTTGSATVPIEPDSVRVTFGAQVRFASVKEARLESEKLAKRITDALTALKIDKLKVEATSENLQVTMSNNPAGVVVAPDMPPVATGYQVKTLFTVTARATDMAKLRDIAKRVVDAAVENGANLGAGGRYTVPEDGFNWGRVVSPGVQLFREDTTDARKQALGQAVKIGLANTEAMAMGAKVKLSKIDAITEEVERNSVLDSIEAFYANIFRNGRPDPPTNISSMTVRVRVTCSFE